MVDRILTWFKHLLSGKDNQTPDAVRVMGFVGFLQGMGLQFYDTVIRGNAFDLQAFGIGMGVLFGAIGAALGLKKDTEPDLNNNGIPDHLEK